MSSHHIIRENQEPALVILSKIPENLLSQLCEWNPKIFCLSSLLGWVESMQLKIDVVLGLADRKTESLRKMAYQMPLDYMEMADMEELEGVILNIDNRSIHIAGNMKLKQEILLPGNKEIIHFSNEFKSYGFSKKWRKWKIAGEFLEIESGEIESTVNLKVENTGFRVAEHGRCEIYVKTAGIIREYHSG